MATEIEKKDEQKPGEEEASDTTSVFMEELGRQFAKSDAVKEKKAATLEPAAPAATTPGTEDKPSPEEKHVVEKPKEQPATEQPLSAEDESLLKDWGIPSTEATPAVRAAIKKERARIAEVEKRATEAEGKWKQSSSQNKQVSDMYQKLKKENKALLDRMATDPQNVMEFADKLFSEDELNKLPQGSKDILGDKDARLAFTMLVTKMAQLGQQQLDSQNHDEIPPNPPAAIDGDPLSEANTAPEQPTVPQQPRLTPEQVKARDEFVDKKMDEFGFGNYRDTYKSPEWTEYAKSVIDGEIKSMLELNHAAGMPIPSAPALLSPTFQKLRTNNPFLHAEVLRGFKQYQDAKSESLKADRERQQRAAGLEGHGDTKPQTKTAGKTLGELTPEEMQALPAAEFKRLDRDKSARTTLYG